MNEFTPENVQKFLRENEFEFSSTHKKICFPILKRIYDKLLEGKRFDGIKIEDAIIVNGHHRYICLKFLSLEVETINWTRSPSTEVIPWDLVEIDITEWESDEDIAKHN